MPDVYVRLREAGLEDGEPIPADGTVTLSPIHVVDPDAWVTAAATVLHVRDGVAAPVSVSTGRWRVTARSRSWERSWVLDLEDGDTPLNLVSLTPIDDPAPIPWGPTLADAAKVGEAVKKSETAIRLAQVAAELRTYPLLSRSRGDGTATISGWLSSRNEGEGTVSIRSMQEPANPADHWSVNPLAAMQGRSVTALSVVHGRLYSGFGDWNANGDRVGVVSHDLETGEARVDFFPVDSEAVEAFIGGRDGRSIYVPHTDGNKNYWAGCGYASYERVDGDWRWENTILPGQAIHVFDMVETDEGLWACGSAIPADQGGGTSALWFRPNGGEWVVRYKGVEDHGGKGGASRFYRLATDGHAVRAQDRSLAVDGLEVTAGSVTRIPRISGEHAFVDGEWTTITTTQKVIGGAVYDRPSGVSSGAWTVHDGYIYSASGFGGINRKEL